MASRQKKKSDGLEVIYSRQRTDYVKGKTYSNPRFFTTARSDAKKVFLIGDWPKIEAAYKALGIPVERLDATEASELAPLPADRVEALTAAKQADYSHIDIPEDWRDLPWIGEQSMRHLAMQLSDTPILNKSQAVAVIAAELSRRGVEA